MHPCTVETATGYINVHKFNFFFFFLLKVCITPPFHLPGPIEYKVLNQTHMMPECSSRWPPLQEWLTCCTRLSMPGMWMQWWIYWRKVCLVYYNTNWSKVICFLNRRWITEMYLFLSVCWILLIEGQVHIFSCQVHNTLYATACSFLLILGGKHK